MQYNYTCVWNEADFQEGTNHCRHIASLVVAQCTPLGNHQSVHCYTHVAVAGRDGEREGEEKKREEKRESQL